SRIFHEATLSDVEVLEALYAATARPGAELVRGVGGIAEGVPEEFGEIPSLPKFRSDGILLAHAGGGAGLFSSMIGGWVNGEMGSNPVTVEVRR
ncbi:MAG TPA: thioredoxin, partial [Acidimicrobiaceae bacterium]|nr:thioredoxin [Acidimicrobiaceae bacterium]